MNFFETFSIETAEKRCAVEKFVKDFDEYAGVSIHINQRQQSSETNRG